MSWRVDSRGGAASRSCHPPGPPKKNRGKNGSGRVPWVGGASTRQARFTLQTRQKETVGRGTGWKGYRLEGVQLGVGALVKVSAAAHALGPRPLDLGQTSLCPRSPLSARR